MQENGTGRNKVEPPKKKRVKKIIKLKISREDSLQGQRGKSKRLPELKSQARVKNFIYIQDPESMQHTDLKRSRGQQMSHPNTGKKKVPGPNIIKKHQQKKDYSLRSRHSIKNVIVLEISHSRECAQLAVNE